MQVNADDVLSLGLLGLPILALTGVLLEARQLLRWWRKAPQRPLSRRKGLVAVLALGIAVSLAATAYAQFFNLLFSDVLGHVTVIATTQIAWIVIVRSVPNWLLVCWIINTEIAPPLLTTAAVVSRMLPRDRRIVLLVGGTISALPTLLLLLFSLWMGIRASHY
jgi:hypothetical protein